MQSEAYKLSGFTLVASALGFLLRWLQDMRIMNEETGLAVRAPISFLVVGIIVLTALALAAYVRHLGQYVMPAEPWEALVGKTSFYMAISVIPAVLLALAGAYQILRPTGLWLGMNRLCGAAKLLGALGIAAVATSAGKPHRKASGRTGAYMIFLFTGFWLITSYREAAAEPIVWRFAVGIVAQCVVMLAFYYVMGYFFNEPHTKWALFMCDMAALLCVMSAIDENGAAQSLTYGALAAQFFIWGFVITENLKTKPLYPVGQEEE